MPQSESIERPFPKRITVSFEGESRRVLGELRLLTGKSSATLIREAIELKVLLEQRRLQGNRILVERHGSVRELVW